MIALGLFTHFLADFIFQTKWLHEQKKSKLIIGNLFHGLIVLITYTLVFVLYLLVFKPKLINFNLCLVILSITLIHLFIDFLKSLILKVFENNDKVDLFVFLIDQFLHIVSILLIFGLFNYEYSIKYNDYFIILSIYLAVVYIGDYAIRKTFKVVQINTYEKKEHDIKGVGSLIGKLERIIILTLLLMKHPEVIIAIIGIKSIARFPEYNDQKNNDYFILGNLMSLFISICGYVLYLLYLNY